MLTLKNTAFNFFKGIFVGFGTVIPGVSGGTAAIIVDIFEDILEASGNFFNHIRKSLFLLIPTLFGVVCGVLILSHPLEYFCVYAPNLSKAVFCILSLISTLLFIKSSLTLDFSRRKAVALLSGAITALSISLSITYFNVDFTEIGIIGLLLIGIPLALALVLPAISFSYMLLFFGLYERTLSAISALDLSYLMPLAFGILLGVFIFSKILLRLISAHSQETYSFVLGFVLCSIVDILM